MKSVLSFLTYSLVIWSSLLINSANASEILKVPSSELTFVENSYGYMIIKFANSPPKPFESGKRIVVKDFGYNGQVRDTTLVIGEYYFDSGGYRVRILQQILGDEIVFSNSSRQNMEVPAETVEQLIQRETILQPDQYFTVDDFLASGGSAIQSGAVAGLSVLLYQGLIYDSKTRKSFEEYRNRIKNLESQSKALDARINGQVLAGFSVYEQGLFQIDLMYRKEVNGNLSFDFSKTATSYEFKSKDPNFVRDLQDIRNTVSSVSKYDPRSLNLKRTAYAFTEMADEAHFEGDLEDAQAFKKYALAAADLLFGIDPVSGTFRSVYESFSGFNFVTGERLSAIERGFAIAGMVSFGYGNKIGQGFRGIAKLSSRVFNKTNFKTAFDIGKEALLNVSDLAFYAKKKLFGPSGKLAMDHPKLYRQIMKKENNAVFLQYAAERQNFSVVHMYSGHKQLITQEMTIEAFEMIDRISKSRKLVRQGNFAKEIKIEDLKSTLYAPDDLALLKGYKHPSKIQVIAPKKEKSIYYGEMRAEVGTEEFSRKLGTNSQGADFVEVFELDKNALFITRKSPKLTLGPQGKLVEVKNPGGFMEVVVPQDARIKTKEFWIMFKDGTRRIFFSLLQVFERMRQQIA